jgi:hypothetical protein
VEWSLVTEQLHLNGYQYRPMASFAAYKNILLIDPY